MRIFEMMGEHNSQYLTVCQDVESGLKAFIAIHNTALGPALGGCRMWNYLSEEDALRDAICLAYNLSLCAAVSGCDLSGGAAVIMGNSKNDKSEELFRVLGRFIDAMEGRFIVTTELGTTSEDIVYIRRETPYVVDLPIICNEKGDEALSTAWGIYYGIMACVKEVFKVTTLADINVTVQGVGTIGSSLVELMKRKEPKVQLSISDTDYDKMKKVQDKYPDIRILTPEESLTKECHVFVPCAMGRILTREIVSQLRCKIIAGGARCILTSDEVADQIYEQGILMAPDFVINAGGVIQAEQEIKGYERVMTDESFKKIALNLVRIFTIAGEDRRSPYRVALETARKRSEKISSISRILSI